MIVTVLSGFALAAAAPFLHQRLRRYSGSLLALLPLGWFIYFLNHSAALADGPVRQAVAWVPSLAIEFSFYLDGLSLLFALLVSGIGVFILIYASAYLRDHPQLGRFYGFILLFMASMLGLVLADNVITLFMFWELTSLSSYFLIGFDHERPSARGAALQALLVTGTGGLALLAGFILLGMAGGSLELSVLLTRGDLVRVHGSYLPILVLVLIGAFTKSAQVPFHFWLPSAMEAPTPVSAYLHSATMVKAGIYLLARLSPVLGETAAWQHTLTLVGGLTLLTGAAMALAQHDLKRILAYSTISSLGALVLLLGMNTPAAARAAMVYLLAHALYKGALFLVAGAVDHGAGSRDIRYLGGLGRAMPVTALAGGLAALSMAGLPPTFGYLAKELLFEAGLHAPRWPALPVGVFALSGAMLIAVAAISGIAPFLGKTVATPRPPHEVSPALLLGPLFLAACGLGFSFTPSALSIFLAPAAAAISGDRTPLDLALWHGWNRLALLSGATFLAGGLIYFQREIVVALAGRWQPLAAFGPARWYHALVEGMLWVARKQTAMLQSGLLRHYLMIILAVVFGLVAYTLVFKTGLTPPVPPGDVRLHEWMVAGIILIAALTAVTTRSRLTAIAALGTVGYGVALVYLLFGAPDLAMTQFGIETLAVVLFVLILYRLPRFANFSGPATHFRDLLVSLANGALIAALVLTATAREFRPRISSFFLDQSLEAAKGRNPVNVILVDFRALDTLGEITVIAVSALGVFALLKALPGKKKESEP